MTEPKDLATARNRFFFIQFVRLGGIGLVLLGLVISNGDLLKPGGDRVVGLVITIIGIIDVTVIPQLLVRHWRSPKR